MHRYRYDNYWKRIYENTTALTGRGIMCERRIDSAVKKCEAEHEQVRAASSAFDEWPIVNVLSGARAAKGA